MFAIMPEMPNAKLDSPRRHLIGYWHLFQHLETAGLTWRSGAVGLITSLTVSSDHLLVYIIIGIEYPTTADGQILPTTAPIWRKQLFVLFTLHI